MIPDVFAASCHEFKISVAIESELLHLQPFHVSLLLNGFIWVEFGVGDLQVISLSSYKFRDK
jgi:hypothetical protein